MRRIACQPSSSIVSSVMSTLNYQDCELRKLAYWTDVCNFVHPPSSNLHNFNNFHIRYLHRLTKKNSEPQQVNRSRLDREPPKWCLQRFQTFEVYYHLPFWDRISHKRCYQNSIYREIKLILKYIPVVPVLNAMQYTKRRLSCYV